MQYNINAYFIHDFLYLRILCRDFTEIFKEACIIWPMTNTRICKGHANKHKSNCMTSMARNFVTQIDLCIEEPSIDNQEGIREHPFVWKTCSE